MVHPNLISSVEVLGAKVIIALAPASSHVSLSASNLSIAHDAESTSPVDIGEDTLDIRLVLKPVGIRTDEGQGASLDTL
jgi:hypothetical protein